MELEEVVWEVESWPNGDFDFGQTFETYADAVEAFEDERERLNLATYIETWEVKLLEVKKSLVLRQVSDPAP